MVIAGGEVLAWRESDISANVALPVFGAANTALAVALIVGWGTFMGHLKPERRAKRAVLTQELGAVYYVPAGRHGVQPERPRGEA